MIYVENFEVCLFKVARLLLHQRQGFGGSPFFLPIKMKLLLPLLLSTCSFVTVSNFCEGEVVKMACTDRMRD